MLNVNYIDSEEKPITYQINFLDDLQNEQLIKSVRVVVSMMHFHNGKQVQDDKQERTSKKERQNHSIVYTCYRLFLKITNKQQKIVNNIWFVNNK